MEKNETPKKQRSFGRDFLSFVTTVLISLIVVFGIVRWIARPVKVEGSSMVPTLHDGDVGFSNIIGYTLDGLERFDIVVIYMPNQKEYLVKRVIGLPGETVSYQANQLYINGQPVEEDFLKPEEAASYTGNFTSDLEEVTLGPDQYWCMGDNRPNSNDSRHYGPFEKSQIYSKGTFILFPFDHIKVQTW